MAKVWWKFEQNRAVGTKVTEQNHKKNDLGMTESRTGSKQYTPPKTTFCGGIIIIWKAQGVSEWHNTICSKHQEEEETSMNKKQTCIITFAENKAVFSNHQSLQVNN